MRKAIATVSLSGSLEEKLTAAAAAGFDGVELFENDLISSTLTPTEVRARAEYLGLDVVLYQPFRDLEAVPPDLFDRNLRRAERKFDVMEQLGAELLLVCSNVGEDAIDDDALAAAQLHELARRAADRGLRIAYEALAWGRHVDDYEHAWRLVAAADHPALGLALDSFHILSRGFDPGGIAAIPGDRIFFVQLADAPQLVMDVLHWSRHYRCFPGQGALDLPAFVGHVLEAGYDGPLSLEVFNDVFRQADADRMAMDAMRSLLALEEAVPAVASSLPAPARLRGYGFLGLATGDSQLRVERLLEALGFRRIGLHASKRSELWQQGSIRLVLERSRGEPRVAALGLESDDAPRSATRAEALLATARPVDGARFEVAAPDGTAVWFCDRDDDRGDGGPLTGIDHVALTQPFDYFDEASLFYRSVLGLEPRESQELAAPYGLVRSRAVTNADGTVRIALNVPVLGERGPSHGGQHIAFACRDVIALARSLRDDGVPVLRISANYYDDLAARFDLDAERLEELRELDVLYDRDEHGEFLHLYTPTLGSRLFFELVQRVGGYDGYGAANSPVRMAAQRQAVR
jgi:4-hydroxyphenylpyruvate dioxygenase